MAVALELLAPAKNLEIGIAAIDCGADAVYIAGPSHGARKDAGNSLEDLASLCEYAKHFGVRIFITVNTIVYDNEIENLKSYIFDLVKIGASAIIIQDLGILQLINNEIGIDKFPIPIHASTQCAIRNVDTAKFLENLGCGRLVLERGISLSQIKAIREGVNCELEFFVHGAICVCYSGQCYISEYLTGRSANRGECIQACRSRYDLIDEDGRVLVRNKSLLSLKDYNLLDSLEDLANAGINSFKIEGRLKNISYVKNVVREYSLAINRLIDLYPDRYYRASYGRVVSNFESNLDYTFNRGYTSLFINGVRGKWASLDSAKSIGEYVGFIKQIKKVNSTTMLLQVQKVDNSIVFNNGDGFTFATDNDTVGFRADVVDGCFIKTKYISNICNGTKIYRNLNTSFEKVLQTKCTQRLIDVELFLKIYSNNSKFIVDIKALSQDGRSVDKVYSFDDVATNQENTKCSIYQQLQKTANEFSFVISDINIDGSLPFIPISVLNKIRRDIADSLSAIPCIVNDLYHGKYSSPTLTECNLNYKYNIANSLSHNLMANLGANKIDKVFELTHQKGIELMRTKYCIKYELDLCPRFQKSKMTKNLYLLNNNRKFPLIFDCKNCEMVVLEPKE